MYLSEVLNNLRIILRTYIIWDLKPVYFEALKNVNDIFKVSDF